MTKTAAATEWLGQRVPPVLVVLAGVVVLWYLGAWGMNARMAIERVLEPAGNAWSWSDLAQSGLGAGAPGVARAAPGGAGFWSGLGGLAAGLPAQPVVPRGRHRGNHAGGFCLGHRLGVCAGGADRAFAHAGKALLPWIVASQSIPVLAIAPIVLVILGSLGLEGLAPKAVIAMYLSFSGHRGHGAGPALAPGDRNRNDAYLRGQPLAGLVAAARLPPCHSCFRRCAWALPRAWWVPWWPSCPPVPRRGWARACSRVRTYGNTLGIWSALVTRLCWG